MLNILALRRQREAHFARGGRVIDNNGAPDAIASDVARLHASGYLKLASQFVSGKNRNAHPVLFEHPLNEKMRVRGCA